MDQIETGYMAYHCHKWQDLPLWTARRCAAAIDTTSEGPSGETIIEVRQVGPTMAHTTPAVRTVPLKAWVVAGQGYWSTLDAAPGTSTPITTPPNANDLDRWGLLPIETPSIDDEVRAVVEDQAGDGCTVTDILDQIGEHGMQSGIIGCLVHYSETTGFYHRHRDEINERLGRDIEDFGGSGPVDLFGAKWDLEDPLALDKINQCLLCWWAFEAAASELYYRLVNEDNENEE